MERDPIDSAIVKIGTEIRAVVGFGNGKQTIQINSHQKVFIREFLATGNYKHAVESSGVSSNTVRMWLRNKKFNQFIRERWEHIAKVRGFDLVVWRNRFIDIFLGKKSGKGDRNAIEAGKVLGRELGYLRDGEQQSFRGRFTFEQSDGSSQYEASRGSGDSLPEPGQVQVFNGWSEVRENKADDIHDIKTSGSPNEQDMVCGPIQESGRGDIFGGLSDDITPQGTS